MIFSIDLYSMKRNTFIFKVFYTIYMHQFGWLSESGEGVTFLICFRKRGVPRKGVSLRKGGIPTLEKTMLRFLSCASSTPYSFPFSASKLLFQILKCFFVLCICFSLLLKFKYRPHAVIFYSFSTDIWYTI